MAESISISEYLKLFLKFSKSDKVKIAEKINQLTFKEQWDLLDKDLPDARLSEDEIMEEVYKVRYAGKN
jgi:hypothetical protein